MDDVRVDRLVWDDWNRAHIARHGVTPEEARQVCSGRFVALESYKNRSVLIGLTGVGRVLAVVVGPKPGEPGTYYVFTARPASRRERRYFAAQMEGMFS